MVRIKNKPKIKPSPLRSSLSAMSSEQRPLGDGQLAWDVMQILGVSVQLYPLLDRGKYGGTTEWITPSSYMAATQAGLDTVLASIDHMRGIVEYDYCAGVWHLSSNIKVEDLSPRVQRVVALVEALGSVKHALEVVEDRIYDVVHDDTAPSACKSSPWTAEKAKRNVKKVRIVEPLVKQQVLERVSDSRDRSRSGSSQQPTPSSSTRDLNDLDELESVTKYSEDDDDDLESLTPETDDESSCSDSSTVQPAQPLLASRPLSTPSLLGSSSTVMLCAGSSSTLMVPRASSSTSTIAPSLASTPGHSSSTSSAPSPFFPPIPSTPEPPSSSPLTSVPSSSPPPVAADDLTISATLPTQKQPHSFIEPMSARFEQKYIVLAKDPAALPFYHGRQWIDEDAFQASRKRTLLEEEMDAIAAGLDITAPRARRSLGSASASSATSSSAPASANDSASRNCTASQPKAKRRKVKSLPGSAPPLTSSMASMLSADNPSTSHTPAQANASVLSSHTSTHAERSRSLTSTESDGIRIRPVPFCVLLPHSRKSSERTASRTSMPVCPSIPATLPEVPQTPRSSSCLPSEL